MSLSYSTKKLIAFDLDNTLAESRKLPDDEMIVLLSSLLKLKKVAIISGSSFKELKRRIADVLTVSSEVKKNLFLFPTNGSRLYQYDTEWKEVYSDILSVEEKRIIRDAFATVLPHTYTKPEKIYGELIEDRDTQISFSGLGQDAPLQDKTQWDPDQKKRQEIKDALDPLLLNFKVAIGGTTTIDITRKGIDKAYALLQAEKKLALSQKDILFVGDAIYPGGNDYAAKESGVDVAKVSGPVQTKKIIQRIIDSD